MTETDGEFWIDGDDSRKAAGKLTYGNGVRSTLEVVGYLVGPLTSRLSVGPVNIIGIVDHGSFCVTLRDCIPINTVGTPGVPGATQRFACSQVFKSRLSFEGDGQIKAKSLSVSMWPLKQWVDPDLIKFDRTTSPGKQQVIETLPDSTMIIPDCESEGLTFDVEIWSSAGVSRSSHGVIIKPQSWFKVIPGPDDTPVENLITIAWKLQLFLTMLADKPAVVNHVSFIDPEYADPRDSTEFFQEWYGGPPSDVPEASDWVSHSFMDVRMEKIGHNTIHEWFRLFDEYNPAVSWLLSRYFHPGVPVDMQFNSAFTAVERLLSQHLGRNRPGRPKGYGEGESRASVDSLVQFIGSAGLSDTGYFKDKDSAARKTWAQHVMSMRDELTVHLDFKGNRQPPEDFYEQAQILTCLGIGFLMTQMKIPGAMIEKCVDLRLLSIRS